MEFVSKDEYQDYLFSIGALPSGVKVYTHSLSFKAKEDPNRGFLPMNLSLLLLDEPTDSFGAVFTSNSFVGAPVTLGRKILNQKEVQGVLINNKISNVGVPQGVEDGKEVLKAATAALNISEEFLIPSSTGIIGWSLPVKEMTQALVDMAKNPPSQNLLPLAQGIMTTDAYPKMARWEDQNGVILGVVKGAGMIEPHMATMLGFILTDFDLSKEELQQSLTRVVEKTFNALTIDSDQSTSDMVWILSTKKVKSPGIDSFEEGLFEVCQKLSMELVRNGEGTSHVIEVRILGAPSIEGAKKGAKGILNSPLVKTAIYGNDPNVGRVAAALGSALGKLGIQINPDRLTMSLGGIRIYAQGGFRLDPDGEKTLSNYLQEQSFPELSPGFPPHQRVVELEIDLGLGEYCFTAWGSDLSHQYINENADYRS